MTAAVDPSFWRGKRVLVTGHTGFKGSWLSLWLQSLGAEVSGLALEPPTHPSLFVEARVSEQMTSAIGDIRDLDAVRSCFARAEPEIVLHLAAQPLVRASYQSPVETYATNVMGTVHVLEAARQSGNVRAVAVITTDKAYENREWVWGYREVDPMGGHDPYSSSKGAAELVTSAYRRSFMAEAGIQLASARAGNVIGGGDWSDDRLVPDILRAFEARQKVVVRNPDSVRPWQHVLEPLSGYLVLVQRLWNDGASFADGWNFGPNDADARPVRWIADVVAEQWGEGAGWTLDERVHPHEAAYLKLDISKARQQLGWEPRWSLSTALTKVVEWHRSWRAGDDVRQTCLAQIAEYMSA